MSDLPPSNADSADAFRRVARLTLKELREILRDRRTIITLLLMPILVYPLLGVMVQKVLLSNLSRLSTPKLHVGLASEADALTLQQLANYGASLLEASAQSDTPEVGGETAERAADRATETPEASVAGEPEPESPVASGPLAAFTGRGPPKLELFVQEPGATRASLIAQVEDGSIDLAVVLEPLPELASRAIPSGMSAPLRVEFIRQTDSALGAQAQRILAERLRAVNTHWTQRLLERSGLPTQPPTVMQETAVEATDRERVSLLTFIPLVIVLMTMTGAVYPAIDLTAGERERGTIEILMAAPVPRLQLLAGKFVAVLVVALLTATMNLLAMTTTTFVLGIEPLVFGDSSLWLIPQLILLLVVFAGFFSAVLLSLTSCARSFKEAQAYLIPLMLISLAPGIFSLMPEIEMNLPLALTPLVNVVLMGRDLLEGQVNPVLFCVAIVCTALYGVLALSWAARVFGSDAILYSSNETWADLFRRPAQPSSAPSLRTGMLGILVLFPAFVIVSSLAGRLEGSTSTRLGVNATVTIILFLLLPLLITRISHATVASTFALHAASLTSWPAAVLLGLSLWIPAYELEVLTLSTERLEVLRDLFESLKLDLRAIPLSWKLTTLAVVPAVCEEFCFRGFLFSAIRRERSATLAVLGSGVAFAAFHVLVRDMLLYERFLPTLLMGLMLGLVRARSGSLYPGILLHVLHNSLLLTLAHFETRIAEWNIGLSQHEHLPWPWLAGGAVIVGAGTALLPATQQPSKGSIDSTVIDH